MIIYDKVKAHKLLKERGIYIDEIVDIICDNGYLEILENPARPGQKIFVVDYKGYIHAAPFIVNKEGNIVIKTVFPSRKFNKLFGGKNEV